jgi:thiol peroxidase
MFKGNPITLGGPEIKTGSDAPDFTAVDNGLQPVKLSQARGKVIVLTAVPSLDTPVCDTETRRFNTEAGKLGAGVEVWTVSMDLPFAQKRWCGAAGATAVKTLSDFRDRSFAQSYGVLVKEGPLAGLTARAVFVVAELRRGPDRGQAGGRRVSRVRSDRHRPQVAANLAKDGRPS